MRNHQLSTHASRLSLLCVLVASLFGCVDDVHEDDAVASAVRACTSEQEAPAPERTVTGGKALLVVGNTNLGAGDVAVRARLQELGFTVTAKRAIATQAGDATGKHLVVISSTTLSTDLGTRLRDVAVPLVTWEDSLFDDLRLTGGTDGSDYGTRDARSIDVVLPAHPIAQAAHLGAGEVDVFDGRDELRWGKPGAAAHVVARLHGSSKAAVFTYDQGVALVGGGSAAQRRVGLYYGDETARRFTGTGWKLFDAAMLWAAGLPTLGAPAGDVLFVVGKTQLSSADQVLRSRLLGLGLTVALRDGAIVDADDAAARKLVLISESVDSTTVGTRLRDVAVPVVSLEQGLFDELRLTGPTRNSDYGDKGGQNKIRIVAPTHPIAVAAGLGAGLVKVVGCSDTFHWGRPGAAAQVVATLADQAHRATIFTYDAGATLVGGQPAPARRAGAFLSGKTATRLRPAGLLVFDAIVRWAIEAPGPGCVPQAETCNGADDDCDGQIDEAVTTTFFGDQDGDGFGVASMAVTACTAPAGHVAAAGDCDDADAARHPGAPELCNGVDDDCSGGADEGLATQTYYRDADGDGFGLALVSVVACTPPAGYVVAAGDCDDTSAARRPGATEVCNLIDDNCSGTADEGVQTTFYRDVDGDGFGVAAPTAAACSQPSGYAAVGGDCDDGNVARRPGAPELCNHVDDNCNGVLDDGLATQTYYRDQDADHFGLAASAIVDCALPAGYASTPGDCDDTSATRHPGAPEHCNLLDDDCDGTTDELPVDGTTFYADVDADGFGAPSGSVTACESPTTGGDWVEAAGDCDDLDDGVHPGQPEACDSVDQDCNGQVDDAIWYEDFDADGVGNASVVVALGCPAPIQPPAVANVAGDCNDGDDHIRPDAAEVCNLVDDDCDGFTDENAVDALEWYVDADHDGYGDFDLPVAACVQPDDTSVNDDDCDDTRAAVNPGQSEVPGNGLDDDCDGTSN